MQYKAIQANARRNKEILKNLPTMKTQKDWMPILCGFQGTDRYSVQQMYNKSVLSGAISWVNLYPWQNPNYHIAPYWHKPRQYGVFWFSKTHPGCRFFRAKFYYASRIRKWSAPAWKIRIFCYARKACKTQCFRALGCNPSYTQTVQGRFFRAKYSYTSSLNGGIQYYEPGELIFRHCQEKRDQGREQEASAVISAV